MEAADEGKYEVLLTNDLGEAQTEGKLTLSGAPQFKEKIGDQIAAIDDEFKIIAKVTGNPTLTWSVVALTSLIKTSTDITDIVYTLSA